MSVCVSVVLVCVRELAFVLQCIGVTNPICGVVVLACHTCPVEGQFHSILHGRFVLSFFACEVFIHCMVPENDRAFRRLFSGSVRVPSDVPYPFLVSSPGGRAHLLWGCLSLAASAMRPLSAREEAVKRAPEAPSWVIAQRRRLEEYTSEYWARNTGWRPGAAAAPSLPPDAGVRYESQRPMDARSRENLDLRIVGRMAANFDIARHQICLNGRPVLATQRASLWRCCS